MKTHLFITLIASLITFTSLFPIDADIFKEMLMMSMPVETQEQPASLKSQPNDCQRLIESYCHTQQQAFKRAQLAAFVADTDSLRIAFKRYNYCLSTVPCAK